MLFGWQKMTAAVPDLDRTGEGIIQVIIPV